ncbi:hypothetical protein NL676_029755 [Syzygium grande]|nr:hypothetical protein NL676_029755 [Syzygium grande]
MLLSNQIPLVVDCLEVGCSDELDLEEEDTVALDGSVIGRGNEKVASLLVGLPEVLSGKVALKEVEGSGGRGVGGGGGSIGSR